MLFIGFGWFLGYVVDALVIKQFAFVGIIALSVWSVIGTPAARLLAFPIAFLLFAVPAGEALTHPLMNFTADLTVGLLRLTGIPVYRDGLFFSIPSGDWSVATACSGIRYLIASVTLGSISFFSVSCVVDGIRELLISISTKMVKLTVICNSMLRH
jgi:exosortase